MNVRQWMSVNDFFLAFNIVPAINAIVIRRILTNLFPWNAVNIPPEVYARTHTCRQAATDFRQGCQCPLSQGDILAKLCPLPTSKSTLTLSFYLYATRYEMSLMSLMSTLIAGNTTVACSVGSSAEKWCSDERESFGLWRKDSSESDSSQSPKFRENDSLVNKTVFVTQNYIKQVKLSTNSSQCAEVYSISECNSFKTRSKDGFLWNFFHNATFLCTC
jgi:hypothetical protein